MNSTITTSSKFVVEYRRYDANPKREGDTDTYRFHWFQPQTDEEPGSMSFYQPFSVMTIEQRFEVTDPEERKKLLGPTYVEARRTQVSPYTAHEIRKDLRKDGYLPFAMGDLPESVQYWIIHSVFPIEFHGEMDAWMEGRESLERLIRKHSPAWLLEHPDTADLDAYPMVMRRAVVWVEPDAEKSVDVGDMVFQLVDIDDEWYDEYDRRSAAINSVFKLIDDRQLDEQTYWSDPRWHQIVTQGMEYQIKFKLAEVGGRVGTIEKAEPLVYKQDWVVETRDGEFGIWGVE